MCRSNGRFETNVEKSREKKQIISRLHELEKGHDSVNRDAL